MLLPHYTMSQTHSSPIPYTSRSIKHPVARCSKFYWNRRVRNFDIVFVFYFMFCIVTNPIESLQILSYSRFCSVWSFTDKLTLFSFVQREVLLTNCCCSAVFSVRFYWQIGAIQLCSAWGFTDKLALFSFVQLEVLLTNWHCSALFSLRLYLQTGTGHTLFQFLICNTNSCCDAEHYYT
jgi:hypothetical protein